MAPLVGSRICDFPAKRAPAVRNGHTQTHAPLVCTPLRAPDRVPDRVHPDSIRYKVSTHIPQVVAHSSSAERWHILPHANLEASARLRHCSAFCRNMAFPAGELLSACLSSAAERGPTRQAPACTLSTVARIRLAPISLGAALTTLADRTFSASSLHHSGACTSSHSLCRSARKASAMALPQSLSPSDSVPLGLEVPLRGLRIMP